MAGIRVACIAFNIHGSWPRLCWAVIVYDYFIDGEDGQGSSNPSGCLYSLVVCFAAMNN